MAEKENKKTTKKTNSGASKKSTKSVTKKEVKTAPKKSSKTSTKKKETTVVAVKKPKEPLVVETSIKEQEKLAKEREERLQQEQEKKAVYADIKRTLFATGIILIGFFLIVGLFNYKDYSMGNHLTSSYLVDKKVISKNNVIDIKNAQNFFSRLSGDYFIFITYNYNKDEYKLEKDIKSLIKSYNLKDKFYYINVDSIYNNPDYLNKINTYLNLRDAKITKLPTIIYVNKNNQVLIENIITRSDNNIMNVGDFQRLLDINNYKK